MRFMAVCNFLRLIMSCDVLLGELEAAHNLAAALLPSLAVSYLRFMEESDDCSGLGLCEIEIDGGSLRGKLKSKGEVSAFSELAVLVKRNERKPEKKDEAMQLQVTLNAEESTERTENQEDTRPLAATIQKVPQQDTQRPETQQEEQPMVEQLETQEHREHTQKPMVEQLEVQPAALVKVKTEPDDDGVQSVMGPLGHGLLSSRAHVELQVGSSCHLVWEEGISYELVDAVEDRSGRVFQCYQLFCVPFLNQERCVMLHG